MKKVYISGRISDLPREQYMAVFQKAEELLKKEGYKVVNPTKLLPCRWPWLYKLMGYTLTLLYDMWVLSKCDNIYKLPGWRESRGANIESCFAYHLKIWPVPQKTVERLDKRLAKLMEKFNKSVNPRPQSMR